MKRLLVMVALAALAAAGCGGDGKLRTRGRVVRGGQPLVGSQGEFVQVALVPVAPDGAPPANYFYAEVDQAAGTFVAAGPDKRGVPPGRYLFTVALKRDKKDQLKGAFDATRSTFVFDIDSGTDEVVLDLDKPPAPARPAGPK